MSAQIQLPHNYYYREMYLSQLTSGPSALTFSRDGKELAYSIGSSLWCQTIGGDQARELSDAGGYDYQPDWSHDGRYVIFTRYQKISPCEVSATSLPVCRSSCHNDGSIDVSELFVRILRDQPVKNSRSQQRQRAVIRGGTAKRVPPQNLRFLPTSTCAAFAARRIFFPKHIRES